MTRAGIRAPAPVRVVFDGQSMMRVPATDPAPDQAMRHPDLAAVPWANVAIGGNGWYELDDDAATRLNPQARATGVDILVLWGGQGDIWEPGPGGDQPGSVVYARLVAYADAALAAGFDHIVACTIPTAGPDAIIPGFPTVTQRQAIDDYNALIVAGDDFDAVARCDTAPFDDAHDTTHFGPDRIHLTEAGAAVAAGRIRAALLGVIAGL